MKSVAAALRVMAATLTIVLSVAAQDAETRQATGLPMAIGENTSRGSRMNVSGRITLETAEKPKVQPTVTVIAISGGAPVEKTVANETGFYFLRNVPRDNITLIVDINGIEVVRQPIIASPLGNPRMDYTVPWPTGVRSSKPGVISAGPSYARTPKSEELFQKAMSASRSKDTAAAIEFFDQLLSGEPADYVAWTELGTTFFRDNKIDNAEACYFKAIELKKDYFPALLNLGKLYVTKKQYENVILVMSNAVAAAPDSADAHYYLGEAYLQTKKGSLAVAQLTEALKLAPIEKAEIHLRLAALYDAAGMKGKAATEFKMYLEKRPDYADKKLLEKYISDNPPK